MSSREELVGRVLLDVSVPDRIVQGESSEMVITLTNTGKESLSVSPRADGRDVDITVLNAARDRASRSAHGERVLKPQTDFLPGVSAGLERIQPGRSYSWRLDFGRSFALVPGSYTVDVSVEVIAAIADRPTIAQVTQTIKRDVVATTAKPSPPAP